MSRRLISAALAALALAACGQQETRVPGNTANAQVLGENENLRRRIAQMEEENKLREQYITEVTQTLATVQENLKNLRLAQGALQKESNTLEHSARVTVSQRDELVQRIEALRSELDANGAKLAEARQRAEGSESKVSQLLPLIAQLQDDLAQRDGEVSGLRTTVSRLQVEVTRRDAVIKRQTATIAERDRDLGDQARRLAEKETERNRIFYRVDRIATLRDAKLIVKEGGLFNSRIRGVWLPSEKLDSTRFASADRRELREIPVDAPVGVAQIITQHDPDSYRHEAVSATSSVIRINDPERFWALGPFLIVGKK